MKKAADGDMDVVTEYTELLKEAEKLGKKIEKVEGEMTAEQIAKFQQIQEQFMKAESEME